MPDPVDKTVVPWPGDRTTRGPCPRCGAVVPAVRTERGVAIGHVVEIQGTTDGEDRAVDGAKVWFRFEPCPSLTQPSEPALDRLSAGGIVLHQLTEQDRLFAERLYGMASWHNSGRLAPHSTDAHSAACYAGGLVRAVACTCEPEDECDRCLLLERLGMFEALLNHWERPKDPA